MLSFTTLLSLTLLAAAPTSQPTSAPSPQALKELATIYWLSGEWAGDFNGRYAEETWSSVRGGAMMGMFRLNPEGRPIYEFLLIEATPEGVFMRFKHLTTHWRQLDDDVLELRLVKAAAEEAIFEGAAGQRPARIVYTRVGTDELRVTVGPGQVLTYRRRGA